MAQELSEDRGVKGGEEIGIKGRIFVSSIVEKLSGNTGSKCPLQSTIIKYIMVQSVPTIIRDRATVYRPPRGKCSKINFGNYHCLLRTVEKELTRGKREALIS